MIYTATLRLQGIIITIITLTVILVSSPVIATFSSTPTPTVLTVGFTSASATSENNDDNEGGEEELTTDVITDEEEVDGAGDVQEEDNTEEEQGQQPSSSTQEQEGEEDQDVEAGAEEQEEQLALAAEICDDFEDNDGDGLIDLGDPNCAGAAGPLTQGTVTAPTTPPPPSVINTTATNSTDNTLTSGLIEEFPFSSAMPPPQAPPTTSTPQVGQIQQQIQQLCTAAEQQDTSPATISPTTITTNPDGTSITSYAGGYIPSSTGTSPEQAPPTTSTPQVGQIQQLCTALQQQIQQLGTTPLSSSGGTTTTNPDGIKTTSLPGGIVVVDNPNGPYVVMTSTGATITLPKSGDTTSSAMPPPPQAPPPQPTFDTSQGAQQGQQQEPANTKNPNDLVTINTPNGVSITTKGDGSQVAKFPGDIERRTYSSGTSVFKYPGGVTVQCSDGSILNLMEGGKATTIEPEYEGITGFLSQVNRFLGAPTEAESMLSYLSTNKMLFPEWFGNE